MKHKPKQSSVIADDLSSLETLPEAQFRRLAWDLFDWSADPPFLLDTADQQKIAKQLLVAANLISNLRSERDEALLVADRQKDLERQLLEVRAALDSPDLWEYRVEQAIKVLRKGPRP